MLKSEMLSNKILLNMGILYGRGIHKSVGTSIIIFQIVTELSAQGFQRHLDPKGSVRLAWYWGTQKRTEIVEAVLEEKPCI